MFSFFLNGVFAIFMIHQVECHFAVVGETVGVKAGNDDG